MNVVRSAGVMARIEGGELSYTVDVCGLQAAAVSCVDVTCVGTVSIASCYNTTVDTCGVGMPEVYHDVWDRLAC